MKKILLISQLAFLAKDIERHSKMKGGNFVQSRRGTIVSSVLTNEKFEGLFHSAEDDDMSSNSLVTNRSVRSFGYNPSAGAQVIDVNDRHPLTGALSATQKARIAQLLGAWEEPTVAEQTIEGVSVSALLQFRRSLAFLHTDFPFSGSFGQAGTREDAIASSQEVFGRLNSQSSDESVLDFEVLAMLGVEPDGSLDQQKLIELIKLFRPDRDGSLTMLDFVKSVDSVYREIRLLRASVTNSSKVPLEPEQGCAPAAVAHTHPFLLQIDAAFENIFNIFFYAVILVVVLSQLGLDPLALFLSISGVILAFAFSKWQHVER